MRWTLLLLLSAAFAGCADTPAPETELPETTSGMGSAPAQGEAPMDGLEEDAVGALHLQTVFEPCDAGSCIDAVFSNEGPGDVYVSDVCVEPHRDSLRHDGEEVHPREPRAHCEAFGLRAFTPQEQLAFQYTWDHTIWDDAEGESVPAPAGTYSWTIHVRAYAEADGGDPIDLKTTHTFQKGA